MSTKKRQESALAALERCSNNLKELRTKRKIASDNAFVAFGRCLDKLKELRARIEIDLFMRCQQIKGEESMTDEQKVLQIASYQYSCDGCVHLNYIAFFLKIEKSIIRKILKSSGFKETEEKGVFIKLD